MQHIAAVRVHGHLVVGVVLIKPRQGHVVGVVVVGVLVGGGLYVYFPRVGKDVRKSSPAPARSGNEWLRYRDIASARRCRVRHGGFVPAGETKLGDRR